MTVSVRLDPTMGLYCVYERPRDFPNKFVVREWVISSGRYAAKAQPHAVCDSLEEARASVPEGRVRFERNPEDDAVIVEVWL